MEDRLVSDVTLRKQSDGRSCGMGIHCEMIRHLRTSSTELLGSQSEIDLLPEIVAEIEAITGRQSQCFLRST